MNLTALLLATVAASTGGPMVEILESSGTVGAAPSGMANRWTRVGVHLRVANRLGVAVDNLEVEVVLVTARDEREVPIPGWRFVLEFDEAPIAANGASDLYLEQQLPALRRPVPAESILYRSKIVSYRPLRATIPLAAEMLGSPAVADQQAGLRLFELDPSNELHRPAIEGLLASSMKTVRDDSEPDEVADALALVLALRATGRYGGPPHIDALLALPATPHRQRWGELFVELAERMAAGSAPDDPRLTVLPRWTRLRPGPRALHAEDAVKNQVQRALVRLGDAAVPRLIEAAHADDGLAASTLHAIGRSTVRSQLAIEDIDVLVAVLAVFGKLGDTAPVAAMAELVSSRRRRVRAAATDALKRIGPSAIRPLLDALGTPNRETRASIWQVLVTIGEAARPELTTAARRYGVRFKRGTSTATLARALVDHLAASAATRWTAEIERGLELGRQGRYEEAFRRLDAVYTADPELYMAWADPIAKTYVQRASALYASGNYDEAERTLRIGIGIRDTKAARALIASTQVALTRGYLDLGQLDAGDAGLSRSFLQRARALAPGDREIEAMHTRLLVRENVVILGVIALLIPGALLAIVVFVRQRMHRRRMQRVESNLDMEG